MSRVTRPQLEALGRAFTYRGIVRREDRLRLLSRAVGRPLHSSSQLTHEEAEDLERRLERATEYGLRTALDEIIRQEERAAALLARAKEQA